VISLRLARRDTIHLPEIVTISPTRDKLTLIVASDD
jgi:hypothetical protein